MIRYLFFLCLFAPMPTWCQDFEMLRAKYPLATMDSDMTNVLTELLGNVTKGDAPTLVAYKGALLTLKAKFAKSVRNKKSYFKKGVELLEYAILEASENIEIRCLRLGVQEHSPKVVKYRYNISEDKQFLLDNYAGTKNKKIKAFVRDYVLDSTLFSHTEKQLFP